MQKATVKKIRKKHQESLLAHRYTNRMWQSILAVLAGILTLSITSFAIEAAANPILMRLLGLPDEAALARHPGVRNATLAYSMLCVALGGYVCARLAPKRPLHHAIVMGALQSGMTLFAMQSMPELASPTQWLVIAALSFPALTPLREALLDDALRTAPALPAGRVYTGVLYAALDIPGLPARAARDIVIVSAQFGALRPADRIPAYKRELDAAHWRDGLRAPLDEAAPGRVLLDCRSATYAAAWRPAGDAATRWVHVAVVEERDGVRRVVSHMAKKTRGEVARHVLASGIRPRTAAELAAAVGEAFACELEPPVRPGAPWQLTVVQRT